MVGDIATIADLSMIGYLMFPAHESGYDLVRYPAVRAWLDRVRALPGWMAPYDLLPGKHLRCYTKA